MPDTNCVSQTAKMKITLWCGQHKEKLQTLTINGARELIKKEFGADLPATAVKAMYDALEIQSAGKGFAKVPEYPSHQIRMLARILRNFMRELGSTNIPPALDGLCAGEAAENGHHLGNGSAK